MKILVKEMPHIHYQTNVYVNGDFVYRSDQHPVREYEHINLIISKLNIEIEVALEAV